MTNPVANQLCWFDRQTTWYPVVNGGDAIIRTSAVDFRVQYSAATVFIWAVFLPALVDRVVVPVYDAVLCPKLPTR